jgi:hypothetical protein
VELLSFFLSNCGSCATYLLSKSKAHAILGLLTLRLVALYKRKRRVVWFIYTFLIVSYAATAFLMVWTLYTFSSQYIPFLDIISYSFRSSETIHYSTILRACGSTTRSPLMPAIFLAPAAFECTLFFLLGYSAWKDAKVMYGANSAPFLTVLYRGTFLCMYFKVPKLITSLQMVLYVSSSCSVYAFGTYGS